MDFISIDKDLCKKDHVCVFECPFKLLQIDENKFPVPVKGAEKMCIDCGHCLAVCPHGALTLKGVGPDDCEPVNPELLPDTKSMEHFFKTRRSIRTYKRKTVSEKTIDQLIELTRWTPTARNLQPVHWMVAHNPETVKSFAGMVVNRMKETNYMPPITKAWDKGLDMIMRGAPHLIIAHADSSGFNPGADCSIALAAIETAAPSFGLGACWAGFFMGMANVYLPIVEKLNLPANHKVYGALMIGYPKFKYHRIPPRNAARISYMDT